MKTLYEFVIDKESKVKESVETKNDQGETVTITKDVVKNVPITFALKKPTRTIIDEADLFYGVKLAEGVKAGLLTRIMVTKRLSNDGGIFSDSDKEKYAKLLNDYLNKEEELAKLKAQVQPLSEDDKEKEKALVSETDGVREQLIQYKLVENSIFQHTAENKARDKTILWWILNISYVKNEKGEWTPFFGDGTFEQRFDTFKNLEESEDSFNTTAVAKLNHFVSFWYLGNVNSKEDFEDAAKSFKA